MTTFKKDLLVELPLAGTIPLHLQGTIFQAGMETAPSERIKNRISSFSKSFFLEVSVIFPAELCTCLCVKALVPFKAQWAKDH